MKQEKWWDRFSTKIIKQNEFTLEAWKLPTDMFIASVVQAGFRRSYQTTDPPCDVQNDWTTMPWVGYQNADCNDRFHEGIRLHHTQINLESTQILRYQSRIHQPIAEDLQRPESISTDRCRESMAKEKGTGIYLGDHDHDCLTNLRFADDVLLSQPPKNSFKNVVRLQGNYWKSGSQDPPESATFWVNASRVLPPLTIANVKNPSIFTSFFKKKKHFSKNKKKKKEKNTGKTKKKGQTEKRNKNRETNQKKKRKLIKKRLTKRK